MFNWNKKEAPLKALAGLGGGVGRGGAAGGVDVELHIYGAKSSSGGRGGGSPYGGYTRITGTATPGTTFAYICGVANGNQNFYSGAPGNGVQGHGGGFAGVWVNDSNVSPVSRNADYVLGVAGGSGAGGDDGYGDSRGGAGGGPNGSDCPENPNQNLKGRGATPSGGGGAGSGGSSGGPWYGGNGGPSNERCGGGGGGWFGGGGGGSNGGYDCGGGGGCGYTGPSSRTVTNPHGEFVVTGVESILGGYPGPGAPGPVGSAYPHTGDSHPATTGRVYIIVDGVEVHDGRSNPSSAASTHQI